jgi:hypothetical protein
MHARCLRRRCHHSHQGATRTHKQHHTQIVTSIYYILSFITTANLVKSYKLLDISISNQIWRAPVAAALLGGLLVLLFNLLSCAILIRWVGTCAEATRRPSTA